MATALDPTLEDREFRNWLKGALAVKFAKDGLTDFVQNQITKFHKNLLQTVYLNTGIDAGTICTSCKKSKLQSCPTNGLCIEIRKEIRRQHRYPMPSWRNTDAQKWCTDAFEVAKCYMPPDGYSGKTSLKETDFNGTLAIIINNKSFDEEMTAQLNEEPNNCTKARVVGRNVRHSPDLRMSDIDLQNGIDTLRNLLQDSTSLCHDKTAQEAVNKLNELENSRLVISRDDVTQILIDRVRATITTSQQEALDAIQNHLDKVHTASVDVLDKIMAARDEALDSIKRTADEKIEQLAQHGSAKDEELFQDLRKDLIRIYRENDSLISVSPLNEENAVPLIEFYVQPPMSVHRTPHTFASRATEKQIQEDKDETYPITSYKQLFLNDDGKAFRNIYVEGDAGVGKTSLAQKLAITWCQAHDPDLSQTSKFTTDEIETMQNFDLLFLLYLRDSNKQCKLQDLIMTMIADKLLKKSQYPDSLLERFLHKRNVLVILDGLDEWSHPDPESCSEKPEVPHNFFPPNCSVLTTTRRWKFSVAGLRPNNIDRHVEISKLDEETSKQLKLNAVELLNRNRSRHTDRKSVQDFDNQIELGFIWAILSIPYILLHLICIWFDGLPVGKSICEVYSNIIELKFRRGLDKPHVKPLPYGDQDQSVSLPSCMNKNKMCLRYKTLIQKLAEVAFKKLFGEKKESRLVFDCDAELQSLTKDELDFCMNLGLLCQIKNKDNISVKSFKLFFPHKTIQEFFAAIYMCIHSSLKNTFIPTVTRACTSIAEILEMSEVFVFVCGMNPEVYSCIFHELKTILECDEIAVRFRSEKHVEGLLMLSNFQSMQVRCLQENRRNLNRNISFCLCDAILLVKDNTENIITLLNSSKGKVKCIYTTTRNNIPKLLFGKLDYGVMTTLEALFCVGSRDSMYLDDVMNEFPQSLNVLILSNVGIRVRLIETIKTVHTLKLDKITMKHEDIKQLFNSFCESITYLYLRIECADHKNSCNGCDLNLIDLKNVTSLELCYTNVSDLRVCSFLRSCDIEGVTMADTGLKHFLNDIGICKNMENLSLHHIVCNYPDAFSLDISCLNSLRELTLHLVPIQELKIPTQGLLVSHVDDLSLKHTAIKKLFSDIAKSPTIRNLALCSIECMDCVENCFGFDLDISSLGSLQRLTLDSVPIKQLVKPPHKFVADIRNLRLSETA